MDTPSNEMDGKKRPPALLTKYCGVCSAPAPDHKHFGGSDIIIQQNTQNDY